MLKLLLLVSIAVAVALEAAPQQQNPFSWLLDSEQWGSKDESSILPTGIFNSCGGSLSLSSSLQIIQMGSFGNNTRCVWSIKMSRFLQLDVHIDSQNFAVGQSGLAVFVFDENDLDYFVMNQSKIPSGDQRSYSYTAYDVAYLTLTSSESGSGSGFRLGVVGKNSGPSYYRTGSHQFRNAASGTFTSHTGNYSNYERSSVVIQPTRPNYLEVKVTRLDTEEDYDFLYLYTPQPYHMPAHNDNFQIYDGYYPLGPTCCASNSTEPRFIVLSTDGSITGTGFSLQWY